EADAEVATGRDLIAVHIDAADSARHVFERQESNLTAHLRHHAALERLGEEAHRSTPHALSEQPIEAHGRTAALQMSKHHRARLAARSILDATRETFGDAPEQRVFFEGVFALLVHRIVPELLRALGHDDDSEVVTAIVAVFDLLAH